MTYEPTADRACAVAYFSPNSGNITLTSLCTRPRCCSRSQWVTLRSHMGNTGIWLVSIARISCFVWNPLAHFSFKLSEHGSNRELITNVYSWTPLKSVESGYWGVFSHSLNLHIFAECLVIARCCPRCWLTLVNKPRSHMAHPVRWSSTSALVGFWIFMFHLAFELQVCLYKADYLGTNSPVCQQRPKIVLKAHCPSSLHILQERKCVLSVSSFVEASPFWALRTCPKHLVECTCHALEETLDVPEYSFLPFAAATSLRIQSSVFSDSRPLPDNQDLLLLVWGWCCHPSLHFWGFQRSACLLSPLSLLLCNI